jgi:hypothetical protein
MPISDELRQRAVSASVDGEPGDVVAFLRLATDPEELHVFVEHWNYDSGGAELIAVMEHPACDLATALMAFWRSGPLWHLKHEHREDVPSWELESFDFAKAVEALILAKSDWRTGIAYDPSSDAGIDWTQEYLERAGGRRLPEPLYKPTPLGAV